jgi:hypothetical protein
MSARCRLSPDKGRGRDVRVARIFKHALLRPRNARRSAVLPLQCRCGVSVVDFAQLHKVGVVAVIAFHQHAVTLQANYGNPIEEVLHEVCEGEVEGGAWAQLLPWRWQLAPVNRVEGPLGRVMYPAELRM